MLADTIIFFFEGASNLGKEIGDFIRGNVGNLDPGNFDPDKKASLLEEIRTRLTGKTSIEHVRLNPNDPYLSLGPSEKQIQYHREYMLRHGKMDMSDGPIQGRRINDY